MTEHEEVERYRKILEDWRPSPPSPKYRSSAVSAPATPVATQPLPGARKSTSSAAYSTGAILLLNQRMLAVYKKPVPEKEFHLVLVLCPNGAVRTQGVVLEGHEVEELGSLPQAWFERLQGEMSWERDLIVFHCYRYEDVCKIPLAESIEELRETDPAPAEPETRNVAAPAPKPEKANSSLRRGQKLLIKFGNNIWDAVYWGKDDQGQVIAHRTYETWSLMHLSLERFASNMTIEPEVDLNLIQEIEQSLMQS